MSPILKAAIAVAHEAAAEETVEKMRWRDKGGGLRMASRRQRRNMRTQAGIDAEINAGKRTYDGSGFTRAKQPRGSMQTGAVRPNASMGMGAGAIDYRAARGGARAKDKLRRSMNITADNVGSLRQTREAATSRLGRKLSRLASRLKRTP